MKVADFEKASRRYVKAALEQVNVDLAGELTLTKAGQLPLDLQDNFVKLGKVSVRTKSFIDSFVKEVSAAAKRADRDSDGYLSEGEGKRLPAAVRDNFTNYLTERFGSPVKDETSAATLAAHAREYGVSAVPYKDAFAKAIEAVMTSIDGETPRAVLAESEVPPLAGAQLDAAMKRIFKGLRLMQVGDSSESGRDPEHAWIFAVSANAGSDHAFFVSVDRTTGEASVTGFN